MITLFIKQPTRWNERNHPREMVSWYEAVAFCRWLSARLEKIIHLPTEWQWQQAATGGKPQNTYPWGRDWDSARCNSDESRLNRTTAVGLYPEGTWPEGPLDMAGNVWEWCLNKEGEQEEPATPILDRSIPRRMLHGIINMVGTVWERSSKPHAPRAVRGGSWLDSPADMRSLAGFRFDPGLRSNDLGFRLAQDL